MKRYPKYKNSGVGWIGEIPEHWKVVKLKYVADANPSGIDKKSKENEDNILLCNYMDVYKNEFISSELNFMKATANEEQIRKFILKKGDVIVTKDSETPDDIANPALVIEDFNNVVCGYHLTHIKSQKTNGEYLFRCFQTKYINSYFKVSANGVTRYGLSVDKFKSVLILGPSKLEQSIIAKYLDRKTTQIDVLIAKKEKKIELLKEERMVVINQVVTKGLDPDVEMKDSGIEWLGDIPKHWGAKKAQYLGKFQNGISEGFEYFGSGYPFISYGDVYNSMVLPATVEGLARSSVEERERMSVEEGDVLFTRTSETIEEIGISSVCMQGVKDAIFSGFIIRFRPTTPLLTKDFSKYFFRSAVTRKFFIKEMNIVTRASLAQDLLKRLPVLLPPSNEQNEIADFLDHKTKQIDEQVGREQELIGLLKEYRIALISEVVTGKIDVRGNA